MFDVIAIGDTVITEDVAVIPDALDNGGRLRVHRLFLSGIETNADHNSCDGIQYPKEFY